MGMRPAAPAAAGPGLWCCIAAILLTLATTTPTAAAAETCTNGVLQLIPPANPATRTREDRWCFDLFPGPDLASTASIKAICGAAFKATVTGSTIRIVPLVQGSFPYSTPGPPYPPSPFNCKDLNASGLFNPGSTTAATLMLFSDAVALSNLTKTGPSRVSLSVGTSSAPKSSPPIPCTYHYAVVSGCVLGAKPAAKTPPPCPAGTAPRTGRFGIKYCTPCPRGTYSPGGAAGTTTCTPCPIGTASDIMGAGKCAACMPSMAQYAPKPGLINCQNCYDPSGNVWTDGKARCGTCPAGSSALPTKPHQCVRCYAGKKCCTVNADKDCPKCTSSTPTPVPGQRNSRT